MPSMLRRRSGEVRGLTSPAKDRRRFTILSYGGHDNRFSKDLIKVDFTTCRPLGEPARAPDSVCSSSSASLQSWPTAPTSPYSDHRPSWSPTTESPDPMCSPYWPAQDSPPDSPTPFRRLSPSSSIYSDSRRSCLLADLRSDSTEELTQLLRQPEMGTLLTGRRGFTRTLNVNGVLVSLGDERLPEVISGIPHLRTIWTFHLLDPYKYEVDDDILRQAMEVAPVAVCNHLTARAPDGYGEASAYSNGPMRQPDEECIPDDGFRLSVQCRTCDTLYSVEVASTRSTQWDGVSEPYLQIQSWRPI